MKKQCGPPECSITKEIVDELDIEHLFCDATQVERAMTWVTSTARAHAFRFPVNLISEGLNMAAKNEPMRYAERV